MTAGSTTPCNRAGRRTPLYACVAALFGLSAHSAVSAATRLVTSCEDAGPGTLRAVIGDPGTHSGDTVDFSALYCSNSTLSLTTGAISVLQSDLTIQGTRNIQVLAKYGNARLFSHNGPGTLTLADVSLGPTSASGEYMLGGCIASFGSVALYGSELSGCHANATVSYAQGGAIFSLGTTKVKYSRIVDSEASASQWTAYGGAIFAAGGVTARYTTIAHNRATGYTAFGGGILSMGNVDLQHVTVASNSASLFGGGVFQLGGASFAMTSSTVSGNAAPGMGGGGMFIYRAPAVAIANSTIAFNSGPANGYAAGLSLSTGASFNDVDVKVKLQSTLISNNSAGNDDVDFSMTTPGAKQITFDAGSQANLIRAPGPATLPAGTITGACPNLGALRDNGGLTWTHALISRSAAIDHGTNPNNESWDQRGSIEGPRVSNGKADIGAFEVNQNDTIFSADLEGCRPFVLP
jgi:hypothetical protein